MMDHLVQVLEAQLGDNLLFVGLRGSYRRGMATSLSDINPVIITRHLAPNLPALLASVPSPAPIAPFVATAGDLANWPRHELPLLFADTLAYRGALAPLLPDLCHEDIVTAARTHAARLQQYLYQPDYNEAVAAKRAYFTAVLHGAAVRGTFNWAQPMPTMPREQMLAWLSRVLEEL